MSEVTDLLKRVAIFQDLDPDELALVADVCRDEKFVSGQYIFREGESGNRLYRQPRPFDDATPASHDFRKVVVVFARHLPAREIVNDTRGRG